ncbi:MAG: FG-GAP-like repeat-containing protein [Planctomycetes bacterium]|nr:FG-GAP-like repeat-containing protein [Planctomycetota bacterium]
MSRHFAACVAATLLVSAASAQSILRTLVTTTPGNRFGGSIASVGDLNGDGYADLAVGATCPNQDGSVFAVSGRHLSLGTGSQFLWVTKDVAAQPGAQFGAAIVNVGDIDGDGKSDLAVGVPFDYDWIAGWVGTLDLLSGATGQKLASFGFIAQHMFASTLATAGDYDGDGYTDVLVGSPLDDFQQTDAGAVYVLSPRKAYLQQNWYVSALYGTQAGERFGSSVAAADLDDDGKFELIVGAPYFDGFQSGNAGRVIVFQGATLTPWRTLFGTEANALFGSALNADGDVDGDGVEDVLASAPYADGGAVDGGEVTLFSGARLVAGAAPYDLASFENSRAGAHFGSSVDITSDLNGDGSRDMLVGAPDWQAQFLGQENGAVYVYSGATYEQLGWRTGSPDDHLGSCVLGVGDYDGDGRADLAVGSVFSDAGVADGGRLDLLSLFPVLPAIYCTPKANSLGCTPYVTYSGSPSVSATTPFEIRASNVINNKNGLLFYGFDALAAPFQGGTLCVAPPTKRTSVQATGGNPPPNDCSGSLSYDFNALIQSGANPNLVLGQEVFVQYWSRDPLSPSTTSLTNALRFVIGH